MIGDYEFWFKIARKYKMVKFPFDLYWNRVHKEQESKSQYANSYPALRAKVLKEAFDHPDCPITSIDIQEIKGLPNNALKRVVSKLRRYIK